MESIANAFTFKGYLSSPSLRFWLTLNGFLAVQLSIFHLLFLYTYWSLPFFMLSFVLFGLPLVLNLAFLFGPSRFRDQHFVMNQYFIKTACELYRYLMTVITLASTIYASITLYSKYGLKVTADFNLALTVLMYMISLGFLICNVVVAWTFGALVKAYCKSL